MKSIFKTKQETFPYSEISCISKRTRSAFIHLKNGNQIELETIEAESLEENWLHWLAATEGDLIVGIQEEAKEPKARISGIVSAEENNLAAFLSEALHSNLAKDGINPVKFGQKLAKQFFEANPLKETQTLKGACEKVFAALAEDPEYWNAWKANIAVAFQDEIHKNIGNYEREAVHHAANNAAEIFLYSLTGGKIKAKEEPAAHHSLNIVLSEVTRERNRQDAKFGPNRMFAPMVWLMILGEEIGEANQAALEVHFGGYDAGRTLEDYRKEMIQVAAVAVAAVQSYDAQQDAKKCAGDCSVCSLVPPSL